MLAQGGAEQQLRDKTHMEPALRGGRLQAGDVLPCSGAGGFLISQISTKSAKLEVSSSSAGSPANVPHLLFSPCGLGVVNGDRKFPPPLS